jgi:hypothetical protein
MWPASSSAQPNVVAFSGPTTSFTTLRPVGSTAAKPTPLSTNRVPRGELQHGEHVAFTRSRTVSPRS